MTDMNDLCKRAERLLGDPVPDQWTPLDYLDALEAKLREKCHSFNLWWDTKTNKYRADWVRLGSPHYLASDSARTTETEARLAGAIQEAERLQHEGKWE